MPDNIDNAIAALGMLFMLFLVVATASEQIIEVFRGVLQSVGINILKGGVTVAEATKLSAEFMPQGSEARAKAEALLAVARDYPKTMENKKEEIQKALKAVTDALATIAPGSQIVEAATAEVNKLALEISVAVEKTEQVRVVTLRVLSLTVCLSICSITNFNALGIVAKSYPQFDLSVADTGLWWFISVFATAIAASAGSSYWHDMLDKVRATKTALTSIQTAAAA